MSSQKRSVCLPEELLRSKEHSVLKVSFKIFIYFNSARRLSFYFDYVQLAIGGRGLVTQHMRGNTVQNQNNNKILKARHKQSGLNHGVD